MNNVLHEMLFCECMLVCESFDCREFFEFDEVACEPMDAMERLDVEMAKAELAD